MGFTDFLKPALPVIGGIGGAIFGGPVGALAGAGIGAGVSGILAAGDNNQLQRDIARQNIDMQELFAKEGIRWRVADAQAAGIAPLAALGANTASFSPVSVGDDGSTQAWGNLAGALSNAGQDVSRAAAAKMTKEEQLLVSKKIASADLSLEGQALDNQIKATQLRRLNAPGSPPGLPGQANEGNLGQGNVSSGPGESYTIPSYHYMKNADGTLSPVPSEAYQQHAQDMLGPSIDWQVRNLILPMFGAHKPEYPKEALPEGADKWYWTGRVWAPRYKRVLP